MICLVEKEPIFMDFIQTNVTHLSDNIPNKYPFLLP